MLKSLRRGSILILCLWTVAFLSLLAVYIGLRVRQRISLLSRIEQLSQMRFIAHAGIKKSIAVLRMDMDRSGYIYSGYGKYIRHNNPEKFKEIGLGQGYFSVFYEDDNCDDGRLCYGFTDEESKLNINFVPVDILARVINMAAVADAESSRKIAEAIIDWRTFGRSQATGYYSDDYYDNLEFPYEPKNMEFENFDELLLVQGITPEILSGLKSVLTVYGDGRVNVNTASAGVFESMGMNRQLVEKLLQVRRGLDGMEFTVDDHIFLKTFDLASDISSFITLTPDEVKQIDYLNSRDLLKVNSAYYRMFSKAQLPSIERPLSIECVYNSAENRVENWREK